MHSVPGSGVGRRLSKAESATKPTLEPTSTGQTTTATAHLKCPKTQCGVGSKDHWARAVRLGTVGYRMLGHEGTDGRTVRELSLEAPNTHSITSSEFTYKIQIQRKLD